MNGFKVIAEIGCNHEGDFKKAVELTHLAVDVGADIVKYQSYTPERYISVDNEERLKRVTHFALNKNQFLELHKITRDRDILFMSTPLTEDWVQFLNPLCCAFKIASGDITFKPVIKAAVKTGKHIFLSTGAATLSEIDRAVDWIQEEDKSKPLLEKLTLMHCVSAYPTPVDQANIMTIPFLAQRYGINIGYSNHVVGIEASLAAVALGATVIEVHFTDQKQGRSFRDHELSFDQNDLRMFITMAKEIRKSLGKFGKIIQPCESENIPQMRKGIIAAKDINVGEILTYDKLMFSRPSTEFSACEIENLIGKRMSKEVKKGFLIRKDAICVE